MRRYWEISYTLNWLQLWLIDGPCVRSVLCKQFLSRTSQLHFWLHSAEPFKCIFNIPCFFTFDSLITAAEEAVTRSAYEGRIVRSKIAESIVTPTYSIVSSLLRNRVAARLVTSIKYIQLLTYCRNIKLLHATHNTNSTKVASIIILQFVDAATHHRHSQTDRQT